MTKIVIKQAVLKVIKTISQNHVSIVREFHLADAFLTRAVSVLEGELDRDFSTPLAVVLGFSVGLILKLNRNKDWKRADLKGEMALIDRQQG